MGETTSNMGLLEEDEDFKFGGEDEGNNNGKLDTDDSFSDQKHQKFSSGELDY